MRRFYAIAPPRARSACGRLACDATETYERQPNRLLATAIFVEPARVCGEQITARQNADDLVRLGPRDARQTTDTFAHPQTRGFAQRAVVERARGRPLHERAHARGAVGRLQDVM